MPFVKRSENDLTDEEAIIASLRDILGKDVGIAVTSPAHSSGVLLPEEEPAVARAVESRKREFIAGRVAARAALTQIGYPVAAIPSASDRSPIWPHGIVGSITHCNDLCISIAAQSDTFECLGIDAEPYTPLPPEMRDIICTEAERSWLETRPASEQGTLGKRFFCAKESAYKAIYPLTGKLIEFTDMHVTFSADHSRFTAKTPGAPALSGAVVRLPRHVVCLAFVSTNTAKV